MELVTGDPIIQVDFEISLPHDLFANLILLHSARRMEGLSDWVTQTYSRLTPDFKAELDVIMGLLAYCTELWGRLSVAAPPQHAARSDLTAWLNELAKRPAESYQTLAQNALEQNLQKRGQRVSLGVNPDERALRAALDALDGIYQEKRADWLERRPDLGDVVHLLQNGQEIKRGIIHLLQALWDEACAETWAGDLQQMRRCVTYHQRQNYPPEFQAKFSAITGRTFPEMETDYLAGVQRVVFIPSCHIGPYFILAHTPPTLQVSFNCRTAAQSESSQVISLFPPLKALADETRLQILALLQKQEMYAQQVMNALDISQSAASRHLNLLESTGLLNVRKSNNMKYYTINPDKARQMLDSLSQLLQGG